MCAHPPSRGCLCDRTTSMQGKKRLFSSPAQQPAAGCPCQGLHTCHGTLLSNSRSPRCCMPAPSPPEETQNHVCDPPCRGEPKAGTVLGMAASPGRGGRGSCCRLTKLHFQGSPGKGQSHPRCSLAGFGVSDGGLGPVSREDAPTPALEWRGGTRGCGWPLSLSPGITHRTWDGAEAGLNPVGLGAEIGLSCWSPK